MLQYDALESELCFHKSVYALQANYVTSLIDAVRYVHTCVSSDGIQAEFILECRSGYEKFETSVQDLICRPLTSNLHQPAIISQVHVSSWNVSIYGLVTWCYARYFEWI
jgi:glycine cleavage system protein P-like pyridoxal-binding family